MFKSAIESVFVFLAIGLLSQQLTNVHAQEGIIPAAVNALGAAAGEYIREAALNQVNQVFRGQGFGGQGFGNQGFGGQGFGNQGFGGQGFGNQGYGGYQGSPYSGGYGGFGQEYPGGYGRYRRGYY